MVLVACRQTLFPTIYIDTMADISIQFHALPDEVIQFAKDVVRDFGLTLVAIKVRPFEIRRIDNLESLRPVAEDLGFSRFIFLLGEPCLLAPNELAFIEMNPDCLRLDIGQKSKDSLRQSWLSARTEHVEAVALWRKISARLKKITHQGAIAINPDTGAKGFIGRFRYTTNAKIMCDGGMTMLPIAGSSILKFDGRQAQ